MDKPSPGPWTEDGGIIVDAEDNGVAVLEEVTYEIDANEDSEVRPMDRGRLERNARLIASAPELLEALHGYTDGYEVEDGCECERCTWYPVAARLIARIEYYPVTASNNPPAVPASGSEGA
jgi:hypothetical protein